MRRALILTALFFLSLQSYKAFAADYYWKVSSWTEGQWASAGAACDAFGASFPHDPKYGIPMTATLQPSGVNFNCIVNYMNSGYSRTNQSSIIRYGDSCPSGSEYDSANGQCVQPENVCATETSTIAGGSIMGGNGAGIYDVSGCAYSCTTNYSLLDGNTSLHDAQECTGLGSEYTTPEPTDYPEPVEACEINSITGCLDMDKQPSGACPAGTTYGRVNDQDVCVPSGTPVEPLDPGSQGLPDQGGDMQAEGTPDRAGTGGSSTGTGTGSSSGTSTTPDNGDGTSTTVSTETKETNGPATVSGHGDPASWWESQYPDGAAGIASKFSEDVGNGPFMAMLNPLKSLPDGGVAPSWSLDFGIGQMGNYGSHSFELPAGVWAFVRFAILFTTVMTVRKLIFGG